MSRARWRRIHILDLLKEFVEFAAKRANTLSNIERLEQEALNVSSVIENPEVAQALRQDKLQNLQYLKDTYNVSPLLV